jgi:formylglycine-generating enzyme
MYKLRYLVPLFCLMNFLCFAENGSANSIIKQLDPNSPGGKYYLLLIAINNYKYWPVLQKPVNDAKELENILQSRYYIDQTIELFNENATKKNIIQKFEELSNVLTVNDSLLIFYAGHGHVDTKTNSGFWIPVNAELDEYEQINWLPNTQLKGILKNIKSTHICLMSDSCFSGDLARSIPNFNTQAKDYFKNSYKRISRQVLTSGASNETVPDESEFALQLKMFLQRNNEPFVDPVMIFDEIRRGMSETTPIYGEYKDLGQQEGGNFILILKQDRTDGQEVKTTPDNNNVLSGNDNNSKNDKTGSDNSKTSSGEKRKMIKVEIPYGSVKIDAVSKGKIYFKDEFIGEGTKATLENIDTGTYKIRIEYPCGYSEEKTFDIEENKQTLAKFEFREKDYPNMVFVQGDSFRMGDNFGDGEKDEKPVHPVTVGSFWMEKTEVTQKEWFEVMKTKPAMDFGVGDNYPVYNVSWYDAVEFCNAKSIKEGLTPYYKIDRTRKDPENSNNSDNVKWIVTIVQDANGYRLPTESEWEFASRGGMKSKGFKFSGSNNTEEIAMVFDKTRKTSYQAGTKKANELGLFDMSGNVWEWCWDWYDRYQGSAEKSDSFGKKFKVLRGGAWYVETVNYRVSKRTRSGAGSKDSNSGFRIVRSM